MVIMTRHQLRAARALLVLQQEMLARKAGVGITTLRLFENGNAVGPKIVARLQAAVVAEGAVLVAEGAAVDGAASGEGVVLLPREELPRETRERIEAFEMTSEDAATLNPKEGIGRRARVPLPEGVRKDYRAKSRDDGEDGEPTR